MFEFVLIVKLMEFNCRLFYELNKSDVDKHFSLPSLITQKKT